MASSENGSDGRWDGYIRKGSRELRTEIATHDPSSDASQRFAPLPHPLPLPAPVPPRPPPLPLPPVVLVVLAAGAAFRRSVAAGAGAEGSSLPSKSDKRLSIACVLVRTSDHWQSSVQHGGGVSQSTRKTPASSL